RGSDSARCESQGHSVPVSGGVLSGYRKHTRETYAWRVLSFPAPSGRQAGISARTASGNSRFRGNKRIFKQQILRLLVEMIRIKRIPGQFSQGVEGDNRPRNRLYF